MLRRGLSVEEIDSFVLRRKMSRNLWLATLAAAADYDASDTFEYETVPFSCTSVVHFQNMFLLETEEKPEIFENNFDFVYVLHC